MACYSCKSSVSKISYLRVLSLGIHRFSLVRERELDGTECPESQQYQFCGEFRRPALAYYVIMYSRYLKKASLHSLL
ncbi:hypothetical protein L596_009307 [Steinernema carpocapsae]|uniref:Uncharacterized protein n=1 Tax=Steinernema carpocapsae TaxID=34508 RepID=A0A4U5PF02_STECR|nr:hypothetical protein L596_009307 [Steinernema carpocapsae]